MYKFKVVQNECYFIHELMYDSDYRIEYKARKYKNKFIIKGV